MSMYIMLYLMLQLAMFDAKLIGDGVLPDVSWPVALIPTYLLILGLIVFLWLRRRDNGRQDT